MDFKTKANKLNDRIRATSWFQFIDKTEALVLGGIIALIVGLFKDSKK